MQGRDRREVPGETRRVTPHLPASVSVQLCALISDTQDANPRLVASELRRLQENWLGTDWSLELRAVAVVLADLLDQGWGIEVDDCDLVLNPPGLQAGDESIEEAKKRLRASLTVGRDRQLSVASVRKFIDGAVRASHQRRSMLDLVDSGEDLARALRQVNWRAPEAALEQLRGIVDPQIVVCDDQARCSITGRRLLDVWRFFRHTWSLEYRSIPGRQLPILIRNRARAGSPVIGIAMLASPVLRLRPRDKWIGWLPEPFGQALLEGRWPVPEAVAALRARIDASIVEIRYDDLLSDEEVAAPTDRAILRLQMRAAGAAATRAHQLQARYAEALEADEKVTSEREGEEIGDGDWLGASEGMLFVRKRAETLAKLLFAKRAFQGLGGPQVDAGLFWRFAGTPDGDRAVSIALQELRKTGLSSQVADVSVCGAVAPYGELLGGKLVALLTTSKEVRQAYRDRYSDKISLISSQMAGRPITKPAELKLITTTSLYGNGSSQYNRLRLSSRDFDTLSHDIRWEELERTAGFGTVHLGPMALKLLRELSEKQFGGRRVNHRFGEGASPRLRQVREGLDALGIQSDAVLNHATPRLFYGCKLVSNAFEQLLGISGATTDVEHSASTIAEAWRRRWLVPRAQRTEVLERLKTKSGETLLRDITPPEQSAE